jgi:hypothetical protein
MAKRDTPAMRRLTPAPPRLGPAKGARGTRLSRRPVRVLHEGACIDGNRGTVIRRSQGRPEWRCPHRWVGPVPRWPMRLDPSCPVQAGRLPTCCRPARGDPRRGDAVIAEISSVSSRICGLSCTTVAPADPARSRPLRTAYLVAGEGRATVDTAPVEWSMTDMLSAAIVGAFVSGRASDTRCRN